MVALFSTVALFSAVAFSVAAARSLAHSHGGVSGEAGTAAGGGAAANPGGMSTVTEVVIDPGDFIKPPRLNDENFGTNTAAATARTATMNAARNQTPDEDLTLARGVSVS